MNQKYPLCEKLGLVLWPKSSGDWTRVIRADDLEAVLQKATRVYQNTGNQTWDTQKGIWSKYQARLLVVECVAKESAEDVLKELVDAIATAGITEYRCIDGRPSTPTGPLEKAKQWLKNNVSK